MRTLLIVATTIAIGGLASLSLAQAQNYVPGGALQQAGMCQVSTDGGEGFYGYMTACPTPAATPRPRTPAPKKREH